jgi:hypothetical protein
MRGAGLEQRGPFAVAACLQQCRPARRWACAHSSSSSITIASGRFMHASAPARTLVHSRERRVLSLLGQDLREGPREAGGGGHVAGAQGPCQNAGQHCITAKNRESWGGRQTRQTRTRASRAPRAARSRTAVRAAR